MLSSGASERKITRIPIIPIRRAPALPAALALLASALALVAPPHPARAASPGSEVDVFAGTRPGPGTFGGGHNFPGAALPFGMVQFSPDTAPTAPHSGGYDYRDHHLTGFSLTHLSGAGCALYGDFPFLPTTEPLRSSPARAGGDGLLGRFQPGFSHRHESGEPGRYAVRLNPVRGGAIGVRLTATTRTGMARFEFPRNPHATVLIDAGGSAQPDDLANVAVAPRRREISGSASSGLFCGQRPRYRVYFAAVFDRPFAASGTWDQAGLDPGGTAAEDTAAPASNPRSTAQAGAYATFDARRDRSVTARVGISFVSVAGARANLAAESHGGFAAIASRARRAWNASLRRIHVEGAPRRRVRTFYTALYHAFLAPRTFNDADGEYMGMDGAVHRVHGRTQYADFSGWDVYRTEIPLLALLAPKRAGDVARSLLADAEQSGCLPRWSYAAGQSMTMVGDSADPILASAASFGARFDSRAALAAMLRGATAPCASANGEYLERQGLAGYLRHGYVPFDLDTGTRNANSIYGSPESVWGSAATTLEYALDDFSISQLAARRLRDRSTYRAFMARSAGWRRLFDRRSGMIEPRYANGSFPAGYDNLHGGGFVEGDSAQYTWMVPQDPGGLIAAMGGRARAAARLRGFLRVLNGGPGATHTDHALLGDEPTLLTPWLFDWMGRPYLTQEAVRRALTLYRPVPDGYPGNDDLGTLSAWYVLASLGIYPVTPGTGVLALSSPAFRRAEIRLPHRRTATISTSGRGLYVRSLRLGGRRWDKPWMTYCTLARGADLAFSLGRRPARQWGAAPGAAPPSYGPSRPMPRGACSP